MRKETHYLSVKLLFILVCGFLCHSELYQECKSEKDSEEHPPWQCHQEAHKPKKLSREERSELCELSDLQAIKALLKPIVSTVRVAGSSEIKGVGRYIKRKLQEFGFQVENDRFTAEAPAPHGTKTFNNIIGTWNPEAPRRFSISCHYDSKYEKKYEFYGATDSALPCALMLDLGATLQKYLMSDEANPLNNEVSLQLVFFDGEEAFVDWTDTDSTYGSRNLAKKWADELYPYVFPSGNVVNTREIDRLDVMVLLDLLGYPGSVLYNFDHGATDLYDTLPEIERNLRDDLSCIPKMKRIFMTQRMGGGGVEDDHIPFMERGVPIVHLIPPRFPPVWHKEADNEDCLDNDTMVSLASILRIFTAEYLHLNIKALDSETKEKHMDL